LDQVARLAQLANIAAQAQQVVVLRTQVGPLAVSTPRFGCGCYFEAHVNGATRCQTCVGPAECPSSAPACNHGYCEGQ
jgi:hypothetical protein